MASCFVSAGILFPQDAMKHLDLFSGIGGFALAARWVGWETVGFCEIEPYCQKVLRKHWPDVPIYEDVTKLDGHQIGPVGLITGGFPCQDISYAGKGAGIRGERSGLWTELHRLIGELRPDYAVLENVSALLSRGLDVVLGDLAEIGYDAEWHCIPASHVGAPHIRDRVWVIAYPQHSNTDSTGPHREGINLDRGSEQGHQQVRFAGSLCEILADTHSIGEGHSRIGRALRDGQSDSQTEKQGRNNEQYGAGRNSEDVAHTNSNDAQRVESCGTDQEKRQGQNERQTGPQAASDRGFWISEPNVGRVAHGISKRVDRLKGLGNAIVPQVAEAIFRSMIAYAQTGINENG